MPTVTHRQRQVTFAPFEGSVAQALANGLFYERTMLEYIEALRLPGAYVDIGACVGTHALFFALFCPATRVHAFEPVDEHCRLLRQNLDDNGASDRVEIHRIGLSDRTETTAMNFDGRDYTIDCKPLDDVLDEPISLIKADVEGMEERVLGGARRLLERYRPLIFVEAHSREQLDACMAQLAPFGYRLTGRVFNNSPTYELACADSPTVPGRALPQARSLLKAGWWPQPDTEQLRVELREGVLCGDADIPGEHHLYLVHDGQGVEVPPIETELVATPGAPCFLQVTGTVTPSLNTAIFVTQYGVRGRLKTERFSMHPRAFHQLAIESEARWLRVSFRIMGTGSFRLERIDLHVGDHPDRPVAVDQLLDTLPAGTRVVEDGGDATLPPADAAALVVQFDDAEALLASRMPDRVAGTGWHLVRGCLLLGAARRHALVLTRDPGEGGSAPDLAAHLGALVLRAREDEIGRLAGQVEMLEAQAEHHSHALGTHQHELGVRHGQLSDALEQTRDELARLRVANQQLSRALEESRAQTTAERQRADLAAKQLATTQRRLGSARGAISFRIGRATRLAVRMSRKNPLAVPWRWVQAFRGPDEILTEVTADGAPRAPLLAQVESAERRQIECDVVLAGGGEGAAGPRPHVAGIVGERLACELELSTSYRPLPPDFWRHLLEQASPTYVLVTADGLAAGSAWAGFGTPGGRDGAAELAALVAWCRARSLPVVYWDTIGVPRPRLGVPRGMPFDAFYSVSPRCCREARLEGGAVASLLPPAVELLRYNPDGVSPAVPDHPIYVGGFDLRRDPAELAALEALLRAGAGRGLEILDEHWAIQGGLAGVLQFPGELVPLRRRRPPLEQEIAAVRRAGLVISGNPAAAVDFASWGMLRALALGANVVSTPANPGDVAISAAVSFVEPRWAGDSIARAAAVPRLGEAWRGAFARLGEAYALRERLDAIATRLGVPRVATEPGSDVPEDRAAERTTA